MCCVWCIRVVRRAPRSGKEWAVRACRTVLGSGSKLCQYSIHDVTIYTYYHRNFTPLDSVTLFSNMVTLSWLLIVGRQNILRWGFPIFSRCGEHIIILNLTCYIPGWPGGQFLRNAWLWLRSCNKEQFFLFIVIVLYVVSTRCRS